MECRNCPDLKNCKWQCMDLPAGKTCGDCRNVDWCMMAYGVKPENTSCDFEPIRFREKGGAAMTRDEAIKRLESMRKDAVAVLDSGFGTRPGQSDIVYRKRSELAEFCLAALNEQEERRWIPVTKKMPDNFVSVLGFMTDAGPFPAVRECYSVGDGFFFPALGECHPVSHWKPLPLSLEEDT